MLLSAQTHSSNQMWWRYSYLSSLCDFLSQVPRPWNISTSRGLPTANRKPKSPMTHLYPLFSTPDGMLILLWVSANPFKIHFFFAMDGTRLSISPCIAISTHTFPALASSATRHHFLLLVSKKKTPSHFPKALFPIKCWVSAFHQATSYQRHLFMFSSQTIVFHSHLWKQLLKLRISTLSHGASRSLLY